jgi:hypothetical protein
LLAGWEGDVDELQGDVDAEGGAVGDGGAEEDGGVEACSPVQGHIGTGRSSSSFTGWFDFNFFEI